VTALPIQHPKALGTPPGGHQASVGAALSLTSAQCPVPSASSGILPDPNVPNLAWVPIELAARTLGMHPDALSRRCRDDLIRRGMAKKLSPVVSGGGGQTKWHVATYFDPRLAEVARADIGHCPGGASGTSAQCPVPDAFNLLLSLPKPRRDAAAARVEAVRMLRDLRRTASAGGANMGNELPRLLTTIHARLGIETSRSALFRWDDLAGPDIASAHGFAQAQWNLVDRRGGNRDQGFDDRAWSMFSALYLRDNKLSARQCWKAVDAESRKQGWTWVSLTHCKRLIDQRLPASTRTLAREGEDAWARAHLPPIVQATDAWAAGECWETDHTRCDFFVRRVSGGQVIADRPWITAFLDRRSRRLMGWTLGWNADSDSIRSALRAALADPQASVPSVIVLDNGKDFASQEFCGLTKHQRRIRSSAQCPVPSASDSPQWHGLFGLLGIKAQFATPYNHNGKARIERFFGVVHQGFDRTLDSWCGSKPGDRDPEAVKAAQSDPLKLPTLDQVREKLAAWFEAYNATGDRNVPDLDGLSPESFYRSRLPAFRALTDKARVLGLLQDRWSRPLTVNKFGVGITISGQRITYGQFEPALNELVGSGKRVHVTYDPADLSSVRVYDERFALICQAPMNARHGGNYSHDPIKKAHFKEAIRRQRQFKRDANRTLDHAAAALPTADLARLISADQEISETKAELESQGAANPPPIRLVRSPLSGDEGPQEQRQELRKAAGAENIPFPAAPGSPQSTMQRARAALETAREEIDMASIVFPADSPSPGAEAPSLDIWEQLAQGMLSQ